jgi:hypothetical protein
MSDGVTLSISVRWASVSHIYFLQAVLLWNQVILLFDFINFINKPLGRRTSYTSISITVHPLSPQHSTDVLKPFDSTGKPYRNFQAMIERMNMYHTAQRFEWITSHLISAILLYLAFLHASFSLNQLCSAQSCFLFALLPYITCNWDYV